MGRAAPDIPHELVAVHGRFARWRESHTGRLPIPEPLRLYREDPPERLYEKTRR